MPLVDDFSLMGIVGVVAQVRDRWIDRGVAGTVMVMMMTMMRVMTSMTLTVMMMVMMIMTVMVGERVE